jgi:protein-disulfide isomerase
MATARPTSKKRPSGLTVVLAFAIAVGAAVALVVTALLLRARDDAPPPTLTPVVDLDGIPQDGSVLGGPGAKVTLIEYADLQCPACRYYSEKVFPSVVNEYVRPGKVKAEFRGYPFLGSDSLKAERFILAAGLQNRLWQLAEALYRNQGSENSGWLTADLVRRLASEIPGLDVDKLFADAESDTVEREAEAARDDAEAAGILGTPSFFIQIGDEDPYYIQVGLDVTQLRAALDDALAS